MATFKVIARNEIDRSQPNYGAIDEDRYDPENTDLIALKQDLLAAGGGTRAEVLVPLVVAKQEGDLPYRRIAGERRLLCLDLLDDEGFETPQGVDCRVLTVAQAADPDYVRKVMLSLDSSQLSLSKYANMSAVHDRFQAIMADTISEKFATLTSDEDVIGFMLLERGITKEDASYTTERQNVRNAVYTFANCDKAFHDAYRVGKLGATTLKVAQEQLNTLNKERGKSELAALSAEFLIAQFDEPTITRESIVSWCKAQKEDLKLQAQKEDILSGVHPTVKKSYDEGGISLAAIDSLKKSVGEKTVATEEVQEILDRAVPEDYEGEGAYEIQPLDIQRGIKTLKQDRKPTPIDRTIEATEKALIDMRDKFNSLELPENLGQTEINKLYNLFTGAVNDLQEIFDAQTRRLDATKERAAKEAEKAKTKAEKAAAKTAAQQAAASPDAA